MRSAFETSVEAPEREADQDELPGMEAETETLLASSNRGLDGPRRRKSKDDQDGEHAAQSECQSAPVLNVLEMEGLQEWMFFEPEFGCLYLLKLP